MALLAFVAWLAISVEPAVAQIGQDIAERDRLIAEQESLLNVYRCRFGVDVGVVPGGCSVWSAFTVPVFFCGPLGRFSGEDVETAVTSLNREVSPWFARESSGHAHIRFVEGGVVIPDFDWSNADLKNERGDYAPRDAGQVCLDSVPIEEMDSKGLSPPLMFVTTTTPKEKARVLGWATHMSFAIVVIFPAEEGYISLPHAEVAAHELAHSLFDSPHVIQRDLCDLLMAAQICGGVLENMKMGCFNSFLLDWPAQEWPCLVKAEEDSWESGYGWGGDGTLTELELSVGNFSSSRYTTISVICDVVGSNRLSMVLSVAHSSEPKVERGSKTASIGFSGGSRIQVLVREQSASKFRDFYLLRIEVSKTDDIIRLLEAMIAYEDEVMTWSVPDADGGILKKRLLIAGARARVPAFLEGCEAGTVPEYEEL
ncbi:MAG: hypothetical protein OXG67_05760 [bacterium]|nr:hypothetical protein [bacterium]